MVFSQIQFNDTFRKKIAAQIDKKIWGEDTIRFEMGSDEPSLTILNLLNLKRVTSKKYVSSKYGLFAFSTIGNKSDILLTYQGKYTFINISEMSYASILKTIINYFDKFPDIDKRLMPIYVQKITLQYLWNVRSYDQYGPWRRWFGEDKTDLIAKEYSKYLYLGLD